MLQFFAGFILAVLILMGYAIQHEFIESSMSGYLVYSFASVWSLLGYMLGKV